MLTVMSALSSIQIDRDGDVAVVVLQGEHDLSTADGLRQAIERAREGSTPVVVDLTEATFIDSAVLGVLIAEHERAASSGSAVGYVVGAGSGHSVHRIIDLAGVAAVLPISSDRATALRAIRGQMI
jgi:anti-sigma B factor antagonist